MHSLLVSRSTTPRLGWRAVLLVGLALLALFLAPGLARANGGPVRIVLTYLEGVSNAGPTDASGVIEVVRSEGEARLTARGMTAVEGKHYVAWIVREGSEDAYRLGEVHVATDGTATMDLVTPDAIPDKGWNMALVTIEDTATPERPSDQRSLAGRYPKPAADDAPAGLPNTGLGGAATTSVTGALVLLAGLVLAVVRRRA